MNDLNLDKLDQLSSEEWGKYYLSRYYFSIQTNWNRTQAGLSDDNYELSKEVQHKLQTENLTVIFHEFFHYLHDVSTVLSAAFFQNRILMISTFTSYLHPNRASSESLGADKTKHELASIFVKSWLTNEVMAGSAQLDLLMRKIDSVVPVEHEVHFPTAPEGKRDGKITIPLITYSGVKRGIPATAQIQLGRFYMLEFLAYEMDQILDKRQKGSEQIVDPLINTEYTVCRMVAQEIFPLVRQEIAMAAGLLALQYIDTGHTYITILQRIGDGFNKGIDQEVTLALIVEETKTVLRKQRSPFFLQQDAYVAVFQGRHQLAIAIKYITNINKQLYDIRIEDPCFELNWLLNREYNKILAAAPLCDYLYKFLPDEGADDPEFHRDFMATNLNEETTAALKTLVAFDHYFSSHRGGMKTTLVEASPNEMHRCPFYTCCDLIDRQENAVLCNSKPWRIYEVQYNRDKRYCWYATGVLEAKGCSVSRE